MGYNVVLLMNPMSIKLLSRKEAMQQGEKFYILNRPCKHGHFCERRVSTYKCVQCEKELNNVWYHAHPEYYELNKNKRLKYQFKYRKFHKLEISSRKKKSYHENPMKYKTASNLWKKNNRRHCNNYYNLWITKSSALNTKIAKYLRNRLRRAVFRNQKSGSAVQDLGCSITEFIKYLEFKFQLGMNWENYGQWHIDHIIPLIKFNLGKREEFLKACHYTNLQPLWAKENLVKGIQCQLN